MTGQDLKIGNGITDLTAAVYRKMLQHPAYRLLLLIAGAPVSAFVFAVYLYRKARFGYRRLEEETREELLQAGSMDKLLAEALDQIQRKQRFFGQSPSAVKTEQEARRIAAAKFKEQLATRVLERLTEKQQGKLTFSDTFHSLLKRPAFFVLSLISGLLIVSTLIAVLIALPIGIISATRPGSFFDYTFMFIALLGLSIPNFWQGLIFILNFSIKLSWLPATYNPQNALSAIMPIVVLGTGLTAAVARMTRSSTLEVIHDDYITTARAKGLARRQVIWKHAVGNALIPIITVIGLQFGAMLGGAAVTEKVFNISGIGSYIVDKQFIPDIPAIMGGVVYTAITISVINVIVDLLYAFFDPRIRSKMKQY